jgi:hypothetical protein
MLYHKFVKNYGKIVTSLTALLKNNSLTWTLVVAQEFQTLKAAMCTTLVLALPDFTKTCVHGHSRFTKTYDRVKRSFSRMV